MIYAHIFVGSKLTLKKSLYALPRLGDEVRLHGEKIAVVEVVVWCLDEESPFGQRANILLKQITK